VLGSMLNPSGNPTTVVTIQWGCQGLQIGFDIHMIIVLRLLPVETLERKEFKSIVCVCVHKYSSQL